MGIFLLGESRSGSSVSKALWQKFLPIWRSVRKEAPLLGKERVRRKNGLYQVWMLGLEKVSDVGCFCFLVKVIREM